MKALVLTALGGPEHIAVRDLPMPALRRPDDVRVRVRCAALNRLDLFVLQGLPGVTYDFPHILGADAAGVVEEVGSEVRYVRPGDRVMVNPGISCYRCEFCLAGEHSLCERYGILGEHFPGSIAEHLVVSERNLAPVPEAMPWSQAAAFSLATLTAWRMLQTRAKLAAGETVLIWGVGSGVSLAALQIAKLLGATAIVTSGSDDKLDAARALGADVVLNHAREDIPAEVKRLTSGRKVDVVVDHVGEKTWPLSLRCLRPQGRLVTCGGTTGPMVTTDVRRLFWYQHSILGSTMGNYREYQTIARLAAQGRLWPRIDTVVPLQDGRDAFLRLERGAQLGKLVIEVSS